MDQKAWDRINQCLYCSFWVFSYMTTYGKKKNLNYGNSIFFFFFLLYSLDTLPRCNPSASSWLPEAWNHDGKSNFLSTKNVSSKLLTNCQKQPNEMQQPNLVFLRLPCVVYSKNENQSAVSDGDRKRMCTWKAPVVETALAKCITSRYAP